MGWVRVSDQSPCPICKKPDWCTFTGDGEAVLCMRVPSDREGRQGGWVHFLDDPLPEVEVTPKAVIPQPECAALARRLYEHERAPATRSELAEKLGVSVASLEALKVGWGCDWNGREWASFPSRRADGQIIGIVRRYLDDGEKRTYPGTSNGGVFCTPEWWKTDGVILVVEGGSDVAAAHTAGLAALGRPSNTGGADLIAELLRLRAERRPVLVVGERDEKPDRRGQLETCPADCPGCGHCFPGKAGAVRVAERLGVGWCFPPEGAKDFREALRSGVWLDCLRFIQAVR